MFGPVGYFKLAKHKKTKEPLGFGFIEFKDDKVYSKVLEVKHIVQGREVNSKLILDRRKAIQEG